MIAREGEKKVKEYLNKLNYSDPLSISDAYDLLSPITLEFTGDGASRISLRQVFFSKEGWAGATNGYMIAFLPVETDETFGLPSTVDAHKTDPLEIMPEGIEITCDHKIDKSGFVEAMDEKPPDYSEILPELKDCQQRQQFHAIKGELVHKLGECLSEDGFVKLYPVHNLREKLLVVGRRGFGLLMTIPEDQDIELAFE